MKIAICEDDIFHRELLLKSVRNYALFHEPSIEVVLCSDKPNELIQHLDSTEIDCYLLDIELSDRINGFDLAMKIREKNPLAHIIFVTTHADRLALTFTYKLAALDFIVKSSPEQMTTCVIDALQVASKKYKQLGQLDTSKWFQIKVGEKIKNIDLQNIYLIEPSIQPHKLVLHEKNGCYVFYGTLKGLNDLGENFFRCHKSCYINLKQVVEINLKERYVMLVNGRKCPVSFRLIRELQKKIQRYSLNSCN